MDVSATGSTEQVSERSRERDLLLTWETSCSDNYQNKTRRKQNTNLYSNPTLLRLLHLTLQAADHEAAAGAVNDDWNGACNRVKQQLHFD